MGQNGTASSPGKFLSAPARASPHAPIGRNVRADAPADSKFVVKSIPALAVGLHQLTPRRLALEQINQPHRRGVLLPAHAIPSKGSLPGEYVHYMFSSARCRDTVFEETDHP